MHDTSGPVYFVVDGHLVSTAAGVRRPDGRLQLVFLPGHSPELNPDKQVWKNVKHDRIVRTGITSADLKATTIAALRRLQKVPPDPQLLHRPQLADINT